MTKARLIDLVVAQEESTPARPENRLKVGIYVAGQCVFAREIRVVRADGKALCRSVIELPPTETDRPMVMIGESAADHESRVMDLHQVRFQSGFICKIRYKDDLFSVTLLRDRDAVWHTVWINYDGPAIAAWDEWGAQSDAEDAAFQQKAAALQGMQESA